MVIVSLSETSFVRARALASDCFFNFLIPFRPPDGVGLYDLSLISGHKI